MCQQEIVKHMLGADKPHDIMELNTVTREESKYNSFMNYVAAEQRAVAEKSRNRWLYDEDQNISLNETKLRGYFRRDEEKAFRAEPVRIQSLAPVTQDRGFAKKKREQREKKLEAAIARAQQLRNEALEAEKAAHIVTNRYDETVDVIKEEYKSKWGFDLDSYVISQFANNEKDVFQKKMAAIQEQEKARLLIADELHRRDFRFTKSGPSYKFNKRANKEEGAQSEKEENLRSEEQSYFNMVIDYGLTDSMHEGMEALPKQVVEERRILRIKIDSLSQQIEALSDYSKFLEVGSKEHWDIVKQKENILMERHLLTMRRQMLGMIDGEEKTREAARIKRMEKSALQKSVFHKENPYTVEGMFYVDPVTNLVLVNQGRVNLDDPTPTYLYRVADPVSYEKPKEYLFREAITASGVPAPERALAVAAATKLQEAIYVDNDNLTKPIGTTVVRNGNIIYGTMQEHVLDADRATYDRFDEDDRNLSRWEKKARYGSSKWLDAKELQLSYREKDTLLREHVVDWLLGSLETTGASFQQDYWKHQYVVNENKALFRHIEDTDATDIITAMENYGGNSIYNVIFKAYSERRIDLPLDDLFRYIRKAEQMYTTLDFMPIFDELLTLKYGTGKKRQEINALLASRMDNLRTAYTAFIDHLKQTRGED